VAARQERSAAGKPLQGRLVPDESQVAEWVDEASSPVSARWRPMVADLVDAAVRAGCHGTFDESVRVFGEDLDSHGPGAGDGRDVPTIPALPLPFRRGQKTKAAAGC
jgi:hypothetical protein